MSKINVLDSSIYNRISAGEVVERPASVVKELIENSLDAKADSITIEIEAGGRKLIKVTDNGIGIEFSDIKKAFLPHATSKISCVEDLDSIFTLGFRGEALASIASVSRIEMCSKTKDSIVGGKICINGGAIEELIEVGCLEGTSIMVRDLFFNTPARLKFLKTIKQEENYITNIVNRLILANPNISFKYIVDNKIIYNSNFKGLKNKIFDIYGKEYNDNLYEISSKNSLFSLSGFISMPNFCKANKTYQTLIINGRYVTNNLISVAVSNAYENFLMKGKFPVFVLNINLDIKDIDVNVHPSKMEVKFKDSKQIYNFIYTSILQILNENNCSLSFKNNNNSLEIFEENKIQENKKDDENTLNKVKGGFSFSDFKNFSDEINKINVYAPKYEKETNVLKSDFSYNFNKFIEEDKQEKNNYKDKDLINEIEDIKDSNFSIKSNKIFNFNDNTNENFNNKIVQEEFLNNFEYKIVGSFFNTYIVIECLNDIYIFDQHASHERILYDKLLKQYEEKKLISQPMLLPYVFNVNEIEDNLIQNNLEIFKDFGFEIENFGKFSYRINSIPNILENINLQEFIFNILSNTTKISKTNEQIKNYFATMACKSAIKAGQSLSDNEIKVLLNKIIPNKTILLCPHGRPICIKFSQNEIEKMFKRIV